MHEKILDQLEALCGYLPLFDRWLKLFPASDYTELAECIEKTCSEYLFFIVESILFFRRWPCGECLSSSFRKRDEKSHS